MGMQMYGDPLFGSIASSVEENWNATEKESDMDEATGGVRVFFL